MVRGSNTELIIRVVVEAESLDRAREIFSEVLSRCSRVSLLEVLQKPAYSFTQGLNSEYRSRLAVSVLYLTSGSIIKKKTTELNSSFGGDWWRDQQRANKTPAAIQMSFDITKTFTAGCTVKANSNSVVVYSLVAKDILSGFQIHAAYPES